MKMHHLSPEDVEKIMEVVRDVTDSGEYPTDKMDKIFKLSGVDGAKFIECKNHPIQTEHTNFEIVLKTGVRFFDPFDLFTEGIYKTIDGWSLWTTDNLKEPWDYDE